MEDKIIFFLVCIVRNLVCDYDISEDEMQALDNLVLELPDVKAEEFRW